MSNLTNIGTACEMYTTGEGQFRYPLTLAGLSPNYLKVIPTCPAAGTDTYSASFVSSSCPDAYTVYCQGNHHTDLGFGRDPLRYTSPFCLDIDNGLVGLRARARRQCQGRTRSEVLAYCRRNGIEVKGDEGNIVWGREPSNQPVAQRIDYAFELGKDGTCEYISVNYEFDARP